MSKRRDVLPGLNPRDELEPMELRSIIMTPEMMKAASRKAGVAARRLRKLRRRRERQKRKQ